MTSREQAARPPCDQFVNEFIGVENYKPWNVCDKCGWPKIQHNLEGK